MPQWKPHLQNPNHRRNVGGPAVSLRGNAFAGVHSGWIVGVFSWMDVMAHSWIKMRTDLARDPAVIRLSEHYGWQEHVIVGLLHKVWSWADEQVEDGNAPGVTLAFLNRYVGVTDFAEQLINVGWLDHQNGGLVFPNWERHMSQTSKRRALTSIRVSAHRNAASVTKTLPDKSREEKSKKKSTKRKATFAKPTPAEVTDYCTERSNGIDGQHFVDHYESRGWVVGQGRTPMTDWKAAVRTWERNGFRAKQTKPRLPTPEEDATWTPYGRADD